MTDRIVVIGGGQAGGQILMSLRHGGYTGELVCIAGESHPPYQRPPLSKLYLAGQLDAGRLEFPPGPVLEKLDVELIQGKNAVGIDPDARTVGLADGSIVHYSKLALATGSRPVHLDLPGAELQGIHYLRTLEDADAIRSAAAKARSAVIVGAGYIGLEVAATLRGMNLSVTVLEQADRILPRVATPPIARFLADLHRSRDVSLVLGQRAAGFEGKDKRVVAVQTEDGQTHAGDLVVVGVGVQPEQELALSAGLACDDGIIVDEHGETSDSEIVAAGDCTRHPNALLNRTLRLESVHNALEQGRTAAATLLGEDRPYRQMPWFWSDQYGIKWQTVGLPTGRDHQIVGDPDSGAFSVFSFDEDRLVSVDSVNRIQEHMLARELCNRSEPLTRSQLEACGFDLDRISE
ncbi:MAG: FAD-dependent oxidoreductase [Xanthomonadales bacterium]|nr:FAD-dependent oxidoreductase [Xanthomonadales bacterium]